MTGARVVITGMGIVVPHGDDVDTVYQRVIRGENECGRITKFDASSYPCQIGSEVRYEVTAPEKVGPYTIHNEALKFVAGATDRALSAAGSAIFLRWQLPLIRCASHSLKSSSALGASIYGVSAKIDVISLEVSGALA